MRARRSTYSLSAMLALSLALTALVSFASSSSTLAISLRSPARTSSRFAISPRMTMVSNRCGKMQVGADLKGTSMESVDYRTFGSSYDGYRSILKKARGVYGDELQAYIDDGFVIIDVRPAYERERIRPAGSVHVPLIKEREGLDVMSVARRWSNSIYAGHSRDLERNDNFVADVQTEYPADAKIVLACGEGLRSLVASDYLNNAGYQNVLWLAGGMQKVPKGVFTNEGTDVDTGYARAGLDGGKIAGSIFDKITGIRWWEMGKETAEKK
eukprot:CAMPEP_0184479748 /NCGR_PEP_ID=MMETSP0113_2-20130426/1349_1 /TAXON_ID=91329 /ORGANISM="Norrisiella sphaerica, Strain BC52" /LENGTH=269 /DNA_ID=CAMNT_0026857889 /DNA_START=88 /DNA_END=897 /DNA_ORIENTATION=-